MSGDDANTLFREMKQISANKVCFECGKSNPQWASVPLGILICLECAGTHRNVGTHLSFVRSITMDSWSPKQLASMRAGGNDKCRDFFEAHGIMEIGNLTQRLSTPFAAAYKAKIAAIANGEDWRELSHEEILQNFKGLNSLTGGSSARSTPTRSSQQSIGSASSQNYRASPNQRPNNSGYSGYGGGDWRSQYSGASSISSNDIHGNHGGGGRGYHQNSQQDYGKYLYDSLSTVSKVAGDAYNNVTSKAKEVDWDNFSSSATEKAQQGWSVAMDYFNKAKQFVGESYNNLQSEEQSLNTRGTGGHSGGYGGGSSNYGNGGRTGHSHNNRGIPPQDRRPSNSDLWDSWGDDANNAMINNAPQGDDMWDFNASSVPKDESPITVLSTNGGARRMSAADRSEAAKIKDVDRNGQLVDSGGAQNSAKADMWDDDGWDKW